MENREIEAKFLEIDKDALVAKLKSKGATDVGKDFIKDVIFYDREGRWRQTDKTFVRIRKTNRGFTLTYKNVETETAIGTEEIEFSISDFDKSQNFLEAIGLVKVRDQEKKRHTFKLGNVVVDIDTWPKVPTYAELEGPSEEEIKKAAISLGFDWSKAVFCNAMMAIERYYHIPVRILRYFTFNKVE